MVIPVTSLLFQKKNALRVPVVSLCTFVPAARTVL